MCLVRGGRKHPVPAAGATHTSEQKHSATRATLQAFAPLGRTIRTTVDYVARITNRRFPTWCLRVVRDRMMTGLTRFNLHASHYKNTVGRVEFRNFRMESLLHFRKCCEISRNFHWQAGPKPEMSLDFFPLRLQIKPAPQLSCSNSGKYNPCFFIVIICGISSKISIVMPIERRR